MAQAVREKTMKVSREALIQAITDYARYPEFVTEVSKVTVLPGSTAEKARVRFQIEVVKKFDYELEFTVKGLDEVSWHLVESDLFKKNEGKWTLKDLGNGHTHATYSLEVGVGFLVPGWVTKKLTENNLPKLLDNFEARALKIAAKGQDR